MLTLEQIYVKMKIQINNFLTVNKNAQLKRQILTFKLERKGEQDGKSS